MLGKIHSGWLMSSWLLVAPVSTVGAEPPPLRVPVQVPVQVPVIERIEPSAGPTGTLLRITGRRLRGQTQVRIGDVPLRIELSTPNLITARVESGVSSGPLHVATEHGQVQGPEFTVTNQPRAPNIERVLPLRAAPGALLTIQGHHFSARPAENQVLFGAAPAIVESATATQLRVVVPEAASAGAISVKVLGAGETRSSVAFEPVRLLKVSEVVPPIAAAGDTFELRGLGFSPQPGANRVYLGATSLPVLEAAPTRLLVRLPPNAKSGRLRVEVSGSGGVWLAQRFEVLAAPLVTGFAPAASALPVEIRVSGAGFGHEPAAIAARLGDTVLRVLRVIPSEIVLEIPPGAHSGPLAIDIGARGPVLSSMAFTVTAPLLARSFQPTSAGPNSDIVIEGSGFGPRPADNRVMFGDVPGEVLQASATRLTVRVPAAAKSAPIRVQVGSSQTATSDPFVITKPPRVVRVSAEQLLPAREFSIFGAGFGQASALVRVTLDAQPLQIVSVREDTIVARAPDAAVTGELTVWVALQGRASYPRPVHVVQAAVPVASRDCPTCAKQATRSPSPVAETTKSP